MAALAVLADTTEPPLSAVGGLALLAAGGALNRRARLVVGVLLAIPGAAVVGLMGDLDRPTWIATAAAIAIAACVPLVVAADRSWMPDGGGQLAFALSALGLYACTPDTEESLVLCVVAGLAAVVSLVLPLRSLGRAGAAVCVGVFVWIAAFDARGRPAAFVGALAALGLLLTGPLGGLLRGRTRRSRGWAVLAASLAVQAALAAYAGRVVGLERSIWTSVALAVPAVVLGVIAGAVIGMPVRERRSALSSSSTRLRT